MLSIVLNTSHNNWVKICRTRCYGISPLIFRHLHASLPLARDLIAGLAVVYHQEGGGSQLEIIPLHEVTGRSVKIKKMVSFNESKELYHNYLNGPLPFDIDELHESVGPPSSE